MAALKFPLGIRIFLTNTMPIYLARIFRRSAIIQDVIIDFDNRTVINIDSRRHVEYRNVYTIGGGLSLVGREDQYATGVIADCHILHAEIGILTDLCENTVCRDCQVKNADIGICVQNHDRLLE